MFIWWLFFSFKGRIGRTEFLIPLSAYMFLGLMVGFVEGFTGQSFVPGNPFAIAVVMFLAGVCGVALAVKRSHDLGRSGIWLIGPPLVVVAGKTLQTTWVQHSDPAGMASLATAITWAGYLWYAWMQIELGFFPGQRGPNRFGADLQIAQA